MSLVYRPISIEEVETFQHTMGVPFGFDPSRQMVDGFTQIFEVERLRAAFDGDQMVATFGTFSFQMNVPGGKLRTGGTTIVTVLPTHRRQGILRTLLTENLKEMHQNGESLAALWASESSIYGRFGYGPASECLIISLEKPYARLEKPADIRGSLRLVDEEEALSRFPFVYEQAATRPGMMDRSEKWWRYHVFRDLEERREGATKHRRVLYLGNDQSVGYAIYRTRTNREVGSGEVRIVELVSVDSAAEKALWQYFFGIDLIKTIHYWNQPVDSPLHWWLEEPRRLQRKVNDQLWVRVLDVETALTGRQYSCAGAITFRFVDPLCPWNEGCYRLQSDKDGHAQCQRTNASPELEFTSNALGTVYLGGIRIRDLTQAGLIQGTPSTVQAADAMFSWDPKPWCPEIF